MAKVRLSTFVFGASLLLLCSAGVAALADGMPYIEPTQKQATTPLDKALDDLKSSVMPEAQATEKAPDNLVPPVPQARTVEVQSNTPFFGLSIGMYDAFSSHGKKAMSVTAEWQPGRKISGSLQPLYGVMASTRGSLFGYAGIGVPLHLNERLTLMPSLAGGLYFKGDGVNIHDALAMRTGAELSYEFDNKTRLGLNWHIISGGGSLAKDHSVEIFGLNYTVPLEMVPQMTSTPPRPAAQVQAPYGTERTETPHYNFQTHPTPGSSRMRAPYGDD